MKRINLSMLFSNIENDFEELELNPLYKIYFLPKFSTFKKESVEKVFQIEKMSKN
jgi:hypothetical protein